MNFLDTSVLVRYFTDDPPDMAARAEQLIESAAPLNLTAIVLLETAHVLRSVYGLEHGEIVDLLNAFVQKTNVSVHNLDKDIVAEALNLCRPSRRISFADALIWAEARSSGDDAVVYSFDEKFPAINIDLRSSF